MHPSLVLSFFAPPKPFHPEELYKHVKELERLYCAIPASDTNARTAQAKAIVSGTDSFAEGCLISVFRQTLGEIGVPEPLVDSMLHNLRGLRRKLEFAKNKLAPLRNGWTVTAMKFRGSSRTGWEKIRACRPSVIRSTMEMWWIRPRCASTMSSTSDGPCVPISSRCTRVWESPDLDGLADKDDSHK